MKKNIEQEKAIAQLEGPVILISCPGSGKTTTLLRRINHMLEVGIPPGSPDTPISQEEVEEERRLFYVAVTRAKERLFITYVGNKKGKPVSRFVRELQLKESGRAKTVKKTTWYGTKPMGYAWCYPLMATNAQYAVCQMTGMRKSLFLPLT